MADILRMKDKAESCTASADITECTPFLAGYRPRPAAGPRRPSASSCASGCRPEAAPERQDGGREYRISCLSYYDPYHDIKYAAHYLIPLKPLLGAKPDADGAEYSGVQADRRRPEEYAEEYGGVPRLDEYASAQDQARYASVPAVVPGAFNVCRSRDLAGSQPDLFSDVSPGRARDPVTCSRTAGAYGVQDPLVAVIQRTLTPNWKVDYVDFTPELIGFESGDIRCKESFPDIINKVNQWLRQNPHIEAKTCEMITWSSPDLPRIGDSESMVQEQHSHYTISTETYYVMGLRVWIVPKSKVGVAQNLAYRDYRSDTGETLTHLIEKVNSRLEEDVIYGNIICFETVMLPNVQSWDTNCLFWRETQAKVRTFNLLLRLFYVEGPKTEHRLGIRNIVPDLIQGNYEPFSCLMRRASQWVSAEPDIRVTNLRSTYVSRNNDTPSQAADRCEHYLREFGREQYFQIIRVYYTSHSGEHGTKHVINCMTFTPVQSSLGPSTEANFERMKSTMLRIDAWIRLSGAKIFSLESLFTPMIPTQPNHTLPEMTYYTPAMTSSTENTPKKFLLHIRIYIDGEFVDPDPRLLPPLPYSLTKQLENSLQEKELKRFYKKKKMRKTQNRIAIATFMFILVTVALVIIIERMLKRYYR